MKEKKPNVFLIIFLMLLIVILMVVIVFAVRKNATAGGGTQSSSSFESEATSAGDWDEDVIKYQGKYYRYNENIHTYLILGIDKEGPVEKVESGTDGGQSDALFLLVTNSEDETVSMFSINRNTMTDVRLYEAGTYEGESVVAQICTQHGFGDGAKLSCERTAEAVSNLFTGIPIDGYFSINMGAIPTMNDGVGGVTLEVLEDLSYPSADVELTKGEVKTLMGMEAYYYLRGRDTGTFDSATDRLRRQEQYMSAFFKQLKAMASGSVSDVLDLYEDIEDYIVTNVDMAEMISELMGYKFDSQRKYTIPGETVMGDTFEEYHVDKEAFHELIVDMFYKEMGEN